MGNAASNEYSRHPCRTLQLKKQIEWWHITERDERLLCKVLYSNVLAFRRDDKVFASVELPLSPPSIKIRGHQVGDKDFFFQLRVICNTRYNLVFPNFKLLYLTSN